MDFIEELKNKLTGEPVRIVFPEGEEPRIVAAAAKIAEDGFAVPVLVGSPEKITEAAIQAGVDAAGIESIDPLTSEKLEEYVKDMP